jgi:hypothetical protein
MKVREVIAIGDARPGMRLAVAVADHAGQVLVPAATELTESLLHSLRRREIAELTVEAEVEEDPAAREARRATARKQVDHLFRGAGDGAATKELYQCLLAFRSEPCR